MGKFQMPFGKYKGLGLQEIPCDYLRNLLDFEGLWDGTRKVIREYLNYLWVHPEHLTWPIEDWGGFKGWTLEEIFEDEDGPQYLEWALWRREGRVLVPCLSKFLGTKTYRQKHIITTPSFSTQEEWGVRETETVVWKELDLPLEKDYSPYESTKPSGWFLLRDPGIQITDDLIRTSTAKSQWWTPWMRNPDYKVQKEMYLPNLEAARHVVIHRSDVFFTQFAKVRGYWVSRDGEEKEIIQLWNSLLHQLEFLGDGLSGADDVGTLLRRIRKCMDTLLTLYKEERAVVRYLCGGVLWSGCLVREYWSAAKRMVQEAFEKEFDRLQNGEEETYHDYSPMNDGEEDDEFLAVIAQDEPETEDEEEEEEELEIEEGVYKDVEAEWDWRTTSEEELLVDGSYCKCGTRYLDTEECGFVMW